MTSLSKDQYNPIVNSSSSISSSNIGSFSIGDITFTDHVTTDHTLKVDGTLEVNGRDVMKELDEMRDALLLLNRDVDMETKYPELKQAYDEYRKILDELTVIEKLTT